MRLRTIKCILVYNILVIVIFVFLYHSDVIKFKTLFRDTLDTKLPKKQYSNTRNEVTNKRDRQTLSHIILDSVEKTNKTLKLLVIISSHVLHSYRRVLIRQLWGNASKWRNKERWKVVFVLGFIEYRKAMEKVKTEAHIYKDIIIEDLAENFYRLAEKVIIGMTWAQHNLKFDAILKGDDDVYIHIDNIILFVNKVNNKEGYYGQQMVDVPVQRFGRYKVNKEEHKNDLFDPYCSGGGFIMMNMSIYKTMQYLHMDRILKIDDAHVGEMAHKAGVKAEMKNGFYMWNPQCRYYKDVMVSHPINNKRCMEHLLKQSTVNPMDEEEDSKRTDILDSIYLLIVIATFIGGLVFAMFKYITILFYIILI